MVNVKDTFDQILVWGTIVLYFSFATTLLQFILTFFSMLLFFALVDSDGE